MTVEPQPSATAHDVAVGEVADAANSGHLQRAYELADMALTSGQRHPLLFNVRANWYWQKGFFRRAISDFEATLAYSPGNAEVLNAIGRCCANLEMWRDALARFDAAISAAPQLAQAHYNRGLMLQLLGDAVGAETSFRRAAALKPDYGDASGSLALLFAQEHRVESARDFASRALGLDPGNPAALTATAALHLIEGSEPAAKEIVKSILDGNRFGREMPTDLALGLLADAFESNGDSGFAFRIHSALRRKRFETAFARFAADRTSVRVGRLTDWVQRIENWKSPNIPPTGAGAATGHVFLLGFIRTGTTLLESVLATHPDISALDERDCFPDELKALMRSESGVRQLAVLNDDDVARFRESYWKQVESHGAAVAGKLFVDKMPFASLRLPLIARLFPDARIIFAVRDPRDVVLSCFRHHLALDATTFEFLLLDDCARFYSSVMRLSALCREKFALRILDHRYEDMILGFDESVRRVCRFIGVEWTDRMREFQAAAENVVDRAMLSREQVRRTIYHDAAGRWRRYARELDPVKTILQPWVEQFGYAAE